MARPSAHPVSGAKGISRAARNPYRFHAGTPAGSAPRTETVASGVKEREIEDRLPSWVRYVHTPTNEPAYNRSWTLNSGARAARGELLILHDNDMICPADYAAEALARAREGWAFQQLKRFTFYLSERETLRIFDGNRVRTDVPSTIVQNLHGASIAATREVYFDIGGFDESFVGWGGEDNEFWERAATRHAFAFAYLPFVHLWHAPQAEKKTVQTSGAPRFTELSRIPPEERIRTLRARQNRSK